MKNRLFAGIASLGLVGAMGAAAPAHAAIDSGVVSAPARLHGSVLASLDLGNSWHNSARRAGNRGGGNMANGSWSGGHRWGHRQQGRWWAGGQAPGGWSAYRRPFHGYVLPRYWIQPSFYIGNYSTYGFAQPQAGFGWSRYYDDAVLTDREGRVYDYRSDIDWAAHDGGYQDSYPQSGYQPAAHADEIYDESLLLGDDTVTHGGSGGEPSVEGGDYSGAWSGNYEGPDDSVYRGSWAGTYADEAGNVYEGEYSGTFTGEGRYVDQNGNTIVTGTPHWAYPEDGGAYAQAPSEPYIDPALEAAPYDPGADYAAAPEPDAYYEPDYQSAYDPRPVPRETHRRRAELIERCRRDNGVGGAIIGGVLGGVAGNVIAGRGDRTVGTVIGAGVGAVAGAAIDQAETDECAEFRRPAGPAYHQGGGYYHQGGYSQGGYYYPPAPAVTTVVIQSAPVFETTTTVVEETFYEPAPQPRRRAARRAPRPKPRCVC